MKIFDYVFVKLDPSPYRNHCMETALELESFQLASRRRNRLFRGLVGYVRTVEKAGTEHNQEGSLQILKEVIHELITDIRKESYTPRQRRRRSPVGRFSRPSHC